MTRLQFASGETFATGECQCRSGTARSGDPLTRLIIPIRLGEINTEAVLDTGGAYLILHPELAAELGWDPSRGLGNIRMSVRGSSIEGVLHRYEVTIPAMVGTPLTFEATVFVPSYWDLPAYMGWHGCLERVRVAVDPVAEILFFGPTD
jgi:predicted aspartyl protease